MTDVVHLSSAHCPLDPRIHYRECLSLARAGYRVTQIAPGEGEADVKGVRIRPVRPAHSRHQRMISTTRAVYRAARDVGAALYHFHDPELLPVGLRLKAGGARVVYDVHEDLPKQVLDKEWMPTGMLRTGIAEVVDPLERTAGRLLDGIVAASSEIADRFVEDKTVLVRNFVCLELVDGIEAAERPVVIYPGSLTEVRGIREIVSAMGLLEGRAELWLMGSWGTPTLEAACRALPGWKHTRFLGRRPLEDVYARMKAASVGLHMPYAVGGYSSGLAIKGFEYMACRLPMVMTDEPAKRQTFGECALFADARHPASIAARIRELLDRPGRARRLGERGRSLVEERYSWAKEAEKLIALYDRLL